MKRIRFTPHILAAVACWLSSLSSTAVAAAVLFDSDTNFTTNTLVKIDPATGSFQTVGAFGVSIQGLAYAPDLDQLYGLSAQTQRVYQIDRSSAAMTPVGLGPHPYGNANGLAYDSRRGRLIASSNAEAGSNNQLFAIDPMTGAYPALAAISGANDVEGLGYDPAGDTLFGLADVENRIVSIDPLTGSATTLVQLPARNWRGLEYDPFRQVFYASVSAGGDFYEIALSPIPTVRLIGFTSPGTQGLALVPEPASFALLICLAPLILRRPGRRTTNVDRPVDYSSR